MPLTANAFLQEQYVQCLHPKHVSSYIAIINLILEYKKKQFYVFIFSPGCLQEHDFGMKSLSDFEK